MNENKHKHLEFIQSTISRMGTNSFYIKGWSVTIVAGLFALAAKDADRAYAAIAIVTSVIFWLLDSYYLSQERRFRKLYEATISVTDERIDFSMSTKSYKKGRCSWIACVFSDTHLLLYGTMVVVTLIVFKRVC